MVNRSSLSAGKSATVDLPRRAVAALTRPYNLVTGVAWFYYYSFVLLNWACGLGLFWWIFSYDFPKDHYLAMPITAQVVILLWAVLSLIPVWVFCDARLRGIDFSFRWAAANCFWPGLALGMYLGYRHLFLNSLGSRAPSSQLVYSTPDGKVVTHDGKQTVFSRLSRLQKVSFVLVAAVLSVVLQVFCFGAPLSPLFLSLVMAPSVPLPLWVVGVYVLGAVGCFVWLVGIWATGVVDIMIGRVESSPDLAKLCNNPSRLLVAQRNPANSLPQSVEGSPDVHVVNCTGITRLKKLPAALTSLELSDCSTLAGLCRLPENVTYLKVENCAALTGLPNLPASLTDLQICNCPKITRLPSLPSSLVSLSVSNCHRLHKLPKLPDNLASLRIEGCPELRSLPELPRSIKELKIDDCPNLKLPENLPLCINQLVSWGTLCTNLCTPRRIFL
jgi:hypothetical protein